jgi:hypothetical protein
LRIATTSDQSIGSATRQRITVRIARVFSDTRFFRYEILQIRDFSDAKSEKAGESNDHDNDGDEVEEIHCLPPIDAWARLRRAFNAMLVRFDACPGLTGRRSA